MRSQFAFLIRFKKRVSKKLYYPFLRYTLTSYNIVASSYTFYSKSNMYLISEKVNIFLLDLCPLGFITRLT